MGLSGTVANDLIHHAHYRARTTDMRNLILSIALGIAIAPAFAANPQQELMKTCNTTATGKKGDERKAYMKSCLSDGRKAQQEKMKLCNVDAQGKKGAERKAFMSACLKK